MSKEISFAGLLISYGALSIPIILAIYWKLNIAKSLIVASLRMSLQLLVMGIYLEYIFKFNSLYLNALWLVVMMIVATFSQITQCKFKMREFFWPTFISSFLALMGTLVIFLGFVVKIEPFYEAQYLIPLTGMILGNTLRGNIVALEKFYSSIVSDEKNYLSTLSLGASFGEAIFPYFKQSMQVTLSPTIGVMAITGLVSMPGMMTGQMLGGTIPLEAIKYQIIIMFAIFFAMFFSAVLGIWFSKNLFFDELKMVKHKYE